VTLRLMSQHERVLRLAKGLYAKVVPFVSDATISTEAIARGGTELALDSVAGLSLCIGNRCSSG